MSQKTLLSIWILLSLFPAAWPVYADSLWAGIKSTDSSYYVPKPVAPRMVHDIIFILIEESTIANAKAESDLKREVEVAGDVKAWFTLDSIGNLFNILKPGKKVEISGREDSTTNLPAWGLEITNDFQGDGETTRTQSVKTKVAATVVEVLPNGNLVLEARRDVKVNNEALQLLMTGLARPDDIDAANQILSSKIAELSFSVVGKGDVSTASKPGVITRILGLLN